MEKGIISLLRSRVGHAREWPIKNSFLYNVFYVKIPVWKNMQYQTPSFFSFNSWNLFSLYTKDHGKKDSYTTWYQFITDEFTKASISFGDIDKIYLICLPRLLGFAFNPISYWILLDKDEKLKAVLCEVHNTFGQTHNYLLAKASDKPITPSDVLLSKKELYVSPFNKIEGHYEFEFTYDPNYFKSTIRYFNGTGKLVLRTFMDGHMSTLTNKNILSSILQYPGMTFLVVFRIHWQALRLFLKKLSPTLTTKPKNYVNSQTTISKKEK